MKERTAVYKEIGGITTVQPLSNNGFLAVLTRYSNDVTCSCSAAVIVRSAWWLMMKSSNAHFPLCWPFVRGIHRSPVNSPHKGQCRGAFIFSLICVWTNDWVNNREADNLKRYRTHYDVIVMIGDLLAIWHQATKISWLRRLFGVNQAFSNVIWHIWHDMNIVMRFERYWFQMSLCDRYSVSINYVYIVPASVITSYEIH